MEMEIKIENSTKTKSNEEQKSHQINNRTQNFVSLSSHSVEEVVYNQEIYLKRGDNMDNISAVYSLYERLIFTDKVASNLAPNQTIKRMQEPHNTTNAIKTLWIISEGNIPQKIIKQIRLIGNMNTVSSYADAYNLCNIINENDKILFPTVHEFDHKEFGNYVIIEVLLSYCGESLNQIKHDPDNNKKYSWALQLAQIGVILHNNKIFHSDIKPSNIAFDGQRVRIIDLEAMTKHDYERDQNGSPIDSIFMPKAFHRNDFGELTEDYLSPEFADIGLKVNGNNNQSNVNGNNNQGTMTTSLSAINVYAWGRSVFELLFSDDKDYFYYLSLLKNGLKEFDQFSKELIDKKEIPGLSGLKYRTLIEAIIKALNRRYHERPTFMEIKESLIDENPMIKGKRPYETKLGKFAIGFMILAIICLAIFLPLILTGILTLPKTGKWKQVWLNDFDRNFTNDWKLLNTDWRHTEFHNNSTFLSSAAYLYGKLMLLGRIIPDGSCASSRIVSKFNLNLHNREKIEARMKMPMGSHVFSYFTLNMANSTCENCITEIFPLAYSGDITMAFSGIDNNSTANFQEDYNFFSDSIAKMGTKFINIEEYNDFGVSLFDDELRFSVNGDDYFNRKKSNMTEDLAASLFSGKNLTIEFGLIYGYFIINIAGITYYDFHNNTVPTGLMDMYVDSLKKYEWEIS